MRMGTIISGPRIASAGAGRLGFKTIAIIVGISACLVLFFLMGLSSDPLNGLLMLGGMGLFACVFIPKVPWAIRICFPIIGIVIIILGMYA